MMDLGIIIISEVSQTKKDKYDITYMWNLKKKTIQMNLFTKQKQATILWLPKGKGGVGDKLGVWD